ncbi:LamG domain-containing protein [Streptomyces sp. NPDC087422]|uniref:LamG domain-containing protein n=1 Tax=Streptomyces sp. NPDC087422 TaxID=3365786 RepID=UPI003819CBE8
MLAIVAGLFAVVPAGQASADTPSDTDSMSVAQNQAIATGVSVPVDDLTTEISTVQADPDGTFTSTTSLLPVRVKKYGAWTPVDASLAVNADGTLSPQATPNAVRLSGGGSGPLVTLTHADGTSMALTMPFALPTPSISDDTALYTSVLPGVDLSVSVTDQGGFSDVLIIHDAAAAADPRLHQLTLATDTQGLALWANASGGMDATTSDGTLAYTSPGPLMWDSTPLPVPLTEFAGSADAGDSQGSGSGIGDAVSSADGPGSGARVETVPMATSADGLTLTPDASVLSDPATRYPLFIDPYMNPVTGTAGHYDELYSNSQCSNAPQYDKPQSKGEGVGYQQEGGTCGSGLERSYYSISTGNLHSSFVVYDAKLSISTTYAASWDCSRNQPITLHTTNAIDANTDWQNKPGAHDTEFPPVTTSVPSGANSNRSCSNHTATFTVTGLAQKLADHDGDGYDGSGGIWSEPNTWTIGLYGNESETSGNVDYLRMSESLTLTTKFDIPPSISQSSLHTVPAPVQAGGSCVTSDDGWIGATTYSESGSNIQLHSTVTSQISGGHIAAHYDVWDRSVSDSSGNGLDKSTPDTTYLASGTDASVPIGFRLLDGHEYGWDVYAKDDSPLHLDSPMSDRCWFKADFTPPDTPVVATNTSFPPVGAGAATPVVYAGPGKTTRFTVADADGDPADDSCTPHACLSSGIDHFIWKLDSQPTAQNGIVAAVSSTASDGTATSALTVPIVDWGVHTLYVAGVDAAGNISTSPSSYTYTVPWNPATKITPGDISGDGVPDLLATTKTGDLDLIPGDTDPALTAAPAQSGPVSGTPPAVTGPVTVSTKADSPDGSGWNNYLIAHRGNLHGADVDDLFAYNKTGADKQLYVIKNDLDPGSDTAFPPVAWSTVGGFVGRRFDAVPKDPCETAQFEPDDSRCRSTDYNSTAWDITQLITPGNVYGNTSGYPAVITVEHKELWLYQSDGGYHLKNPILLGDGDWTGQTLIAPGTVKGNPVMWSRDNATGALYSYPLTVDQGTGLPPLLHPDSHGTLPLTLPPATYPIVASPGDVNSPDGAADGVPDLYAADTHGQLIEYPYIQSGQMIFPPIYIFDTPRSLGTVTDTANHKWSLAEGSGATASDTASGLNATLSGAYTWATDGTRGKVISLSGTTGYGSVGGPAVDNSKSFTVSAWAKLSSLTANSTIVSQSDTAGNANGFQLYYSSGAQAWAFGRHNDDTTSADYSTAYGTRAAAGQWTHLVGVYDAAGKQLSLYVNGRLAATKAYGGTVWNAVGPLQIGRRLYQGAYGEYANAQISNVRTYPSALPPADAAAGGDAPAAVQLD